MAIKVVQPKADSSFLLLENLAIVFYPPAHLSQLMSYIHVRVLTAQKIQMSSMQIYCSDTNTCVSLVTSYQSIMAALISQYKKWAISQFLLHCT